MSKAELSKWQEVINQIEELADICTKESGDCGEDGEYINPFGDEWDCISTQLHNIAINMEDM